MNSYYATPSAQAQNTATIAPPEYPITSKDPQTTTSMQVKSALMQILTTIIMTLVFSAEDYNMTSVIVTLICVKYWFQVYYAPRRTGEFFKTAIFSILIILIASYFTHCSEHIYDHYHSKYIEGIEMTNALNKELNVTDIDFQEFYTLYKMNNGDNTFIDACNVFYKNEQFCDYVKNYGSIYTDTYSLIVSVWYFASGVWYYIAAKTILCNHI
jgi:hypothetical protein